MNQLLKKPSAWIPLIMSVSAFMLVFGFITIYGIQEPQPKDEGTAARIFQLLLAGQLPFIGYFLIKNLSQIPKQTFIVLTLQITAIIIAIATVLILENL